jgi:hypothetical protein
LKPLGHDDQALWGIFMKTEVSQKGNSFVSESDKIVMYSGWAFTKYIRRWFTEYYIRWLNVLLLLLGGVGVGVPHAVHLHPLLPATHTVLAALLFSLRRHLGLDVLVGLAAVVNESKDCSRGELSERKALFPGAYLDVRVSKNRGGKEDCGAGGETDDQLQIPEDEVPAEVGVKPAQGGNRAPAHARFPKSMCGKVTVLGPKLKVAMVKTESAARKFRCRCLA